MKLCKRSACPATIRLDVVLTVAMDQLDWFAGAVKLAAALFQLLNGIAGLEVGDDRLRSIRTLDPRWFRLHQRRS
jgi:hypothetical protein